MTPTRRRRLGISQKTALGRLLGILVSTVGPEANQHWASTNPSSAEVIVCVCVCVLQYLEFRLQNEQLEDWQHNFELRQNVDTRLFLSL